MSPPLSVAHIGRTSAGLCKFGESSATDPCVVKVTFMAGTLELRGWPADVALPAGCEWDARTRCHRAAALCYASVIRALARAKVPYDDDARGYETLASGARVHRQPRPYQSEALSSWRTHHGRGVVVLPTGAGKSHLAVLAIDDKRRS